MCSKNRKLHSVGKGRRIRMKVNEETLIVDMEQGKK